MITTITLETEDLEIIQSLLDNIQPNIFSGLNVPQRLALEQRITQIKNKLEY